MNPIPTSRLPAFPTLSQQKLNKDSLHYDNLYSGCMEDRRHSALSRRSKSHDLLIEEDPFDATTPLTRSRSIPINNCGPMKRSPSESKLREDEEVADFRDYVMFCRIVGGISRQQQDTRDHRIRQVNDMCLARIIGTRNSSEEDLKSALNASNMFALSSPPAGSLQSMVGHTFYGFGGSCGASALVEDLHEDEVFSMDL